MSALALYPFRFRKPLTGKRIGARHKLQVPELQRQYAEWEITGAPEIRHVTETSAGAFGPFRAASVTRLHCSCVDLDVLTRSVLCAQRAGSIIAPKRI